VSTSTAIAFVLALVQSITAGGIGVLAFAAVTIGAVLLARPEKTAEQEGARRTMSTARDAA
jgi:hypothetical protein